MPSLFSQAIYIDAPARKERHPPSSRGEQTREKPQSLLPLSNALLFSAGASVVLVVALKLVENDGIRRAGISGGRQSHVLV